MSERMIYILTGAIQTGKTTALVKWSSNRNDVFGVLSPVIDGKRYFMDVHFRTQFKMEADEAEDRILSIGRFRFSSTSFEWAIHIITESMNKRWLVVDEVGPLELNGLGLCDIIKTALKNHSGQILLVIREGLVERVADFFHLTHYEIISTEKLEQL